MSILTHPWHQDFPFKFTLLILVLMMVTIRLAFIKNETAKEAKTHKVDFLENVFHVLIFVGYAVVPIFLFSELLGIGNLETGAIARYSGACILFSGNLLFIWTHHTLGKQWSAVLKVREAHKLIIDGPYKMVRHPMYTAFLVVELGAILLSSNYVVGVGLLVPSALLYFRRVGLEEQMLLEHFGDQYRDYMGKTGRLFPKLSN